MAPSKIPNFLTIVTDDLGFSGPEWQFRRRDPHLNMDKLGKNGFSSHRLLLRSCLLFYRAITMTGTDNHISGFAE
jgi:arylsulfatase A-like enzyme